MLTGRQSKVPKAPPRIWGSMGKEPRKLERFREQASRSPALLCRPTGAAKQSTGQLHRQQGVKVTGPRKGFQ